MGVLMDDNQIRDALMSRDESVFDEVFTLYSGACVALAWKVLKSESKANDVVQNVFVDLFLKPDRFDPARGSIRTYLLTKTHSKSIDMLRSEKSRSIREQKQGALSYREQERRSLTIEEEIEKLALSESMAHALGQLSADEKQAIVLSYYKGYTYREVAEVLAQPEGTVKSRIRSGMSKLKNLVNELVPQGVSS